MAESTKLFTVKILFDAKQITQKKLEGYARGILHEQLASVHMEIGIAVGGNLLLTLRGSLELVDACHREVTKTLIRQLGFSHYKLIDEAGDEIRIQAYPILAKIEQELRTFVNQSILEILGFEWWKTLGESEIPGVAREGLSERDADHPLELATFDDLIKIVTAEVVEWDENRTLTQSDLVQLLAECESLKELREKLEAKSKGFSFWDNVFAEYFDDEQKWVELKQDLKFIIFVRNKVMHHRPTFYRELITLREKSAKISQILLTAKSQLSPPRRAVVRQSIKDLREIYATMMQKASEENTYHRLLYGLHEAPDVNYVFQLLEEIYDLRDSEVLSEREAYDLQATAYGTLQHLTENDSNRAESIILESLLPQAIIADQSLAIPLSRHRECLDNWINQYEGQIRIELRDKILVQLKEYLETSDPRGVCWTISRIGYRSEEILNALWDWVRKDEGEIGDIALFTIISLGVPSNHRVNIQTELHSRIVNHFSHSLVSCLVWFADPASLNFVYEHWLMSGQYELESLDLSLVFAVFRDILNLNNDNHTLHDQTWNSLVKLAENDPEQFSDRIHKRDLATACNSPVVISSIFAWMMNYLESKENAIRWRYIAYSTLESLIKTRQLEGWKEAKKIPGILELLQQDACRNTGSDHRMSTVEDDEKKAAWGMLFRAGFSEAFNLFDDAVVHETSRFMQQHIMELLACFKIEPLPEMAKHWIIERYDDPLPNGDSREFVKRMAAVRLARSAATKEAFETLLNFGFTLKEQVLRQSSEALIEVAEFLAANGDKEVESKLIEVILNREHIHQSEAAAFALQYVVLLDGSSLSKQISQVLPLLFDEDRKEFERGTLLSSLGRLSDWQIPDELMPAIEEWAVQPMRWLGGGSLEVLIRQDILHQRPDLLTKSLGLIQVNGKWDIDSDTELSDWAPYFIGFLYQKHPESYLPAVLSLLKTSTWLPVQIIGWLLDIYGSDRELLPPEIAEAIILRIQEKQSSTYSEPEIFKVLARLAPEALVNEDWEVIWNNWLHRSRAALADTLGNLSLSYQHQEKAIKQLRSLIFDSHYAVRRSAYRGLARQSPISLYTDCLSWTNLKKPEENPMELRKRAAEAFGWLDTSNDQISAEDLENLYQVLQTDPEKIVRETISRSIEERRQRLWAEQYLHVVMSVQASPNEEVMNAWCYAEALAQIGDDGCIEALRNHLQNDLPPHIRYWIDRLIKTLDKNWRKITEKWPEPWFAWDGLIEQGKGKAIISENEIIAIEYSIWHQRASQPLEANSWGGAMWPIPFWQAQNVQTIELETGASGKIHVSDILNERVIFSGNGGYPSS